MVPIPPKETGLLCVHFNSIDDALRGKLIALKYKPRASELIDHYILECTKGNIEQSKNRFFVKGDPEAILVVEFSGANRDEITRIAAECEIEMRAAGLGYHFPLLFGDDTKKIWTLRKAGLGLLGNMPGDEKAVPVIEDTAVDTNDLPAYIEEFNNILKKVRFACGSLCTCRFRRIALASYNQFKNSRRKSSFQDHCTGDCYAGKKI